MFAETFDLKLDFVPGDANGAGPWIVFGWPSPDCFGQRFEAGAGLPATDRSILRIWGLHSRCCSKLEYWKWLEERCGRFRVRWRRKSEASSQDSDSHVAPKVFLTGKGHRSAAAKAFRAGKRRRKWNEETRPVSAYWRWPHDKPISVESLDFRLIGLSVQAALNQPCQYAVNEFIYILYMHTHTHHIICLCLYRYISCFLTTISVFWIDTWIDV